MQLIENAQSFPFISFITSTPMNKKENPSLPSSLKLYGLVTKALALQKQSTFIQHKSQDWTGDEILAFLIQSYPWVGVIQHYSTPDVRKPGGQRTACYGEVYYTSLTAQRLSLTWSKTKHMNWGTPPQDCNFVKNSHTHIIKNGALGKKKKLL